MPFRAPPHSRLRLLSFALACCALALSACPWSKPDSQTGKSNAEPKPIGVVRLLVVDDLPLAEAITRQWQARAEGELEIKNVTSEELVALKKFSADAIIYPSGLLGELAERELVVPVPKDVIADEQFDRPDLLPNSGQREVTWGTTVYAVSLGSPQLVILYRADLFEQLKLDPPETWADYQAAAEKLSDRALLGNRVPPSGTPWNGACEPLGPGWEGQTLLARAAAYAKHPDQYSTLFNMKTMEPLIAGPPFVKALKELAAAAKLGPGDANSFSPHDVRREFLAGHCGLALTWPTAARSEAKLESKSDVATRISELPGSQEVYNFPQSKWEKLSTETVRVPLLATAGRLGSVTKESRRGKQAFNVLVWISGREWSSQIASQSRDTTLFRHSHLAAPQGWVDSSLDPESAGQYSKAVEQANQRSGWLSSPTLPGRARYLAALDKAVQSVLTEKATPVDALNAAAEEWRAITADFGVDKQRIAYQRSLGIDP